jgi:hypothetical protein
MLKKAFLKLKDGDRVAVAGKQDGKVFTGEVGTIVKGTWDTEFTRTVRFDTWKGGHGKGDHEWQFSDFDRKDFDITPYVEQKPKKRPHGAQEYKGNGKHNWERVTGETMRLRVPGGWLYGEYSRRIDRVVNSTLVPVPQAVGYAV